jgi:hypothetical protein
VAVRRRRATAAQPREPAGFGVVVIVVVVRMLVVGLVRGARDRMVVAVPEAVADDARRGVLVVIPVTQGMSRRQQHRPAQCRREREQGISSAPA